MPPAAFMGLVSQARRDLDKPFHGVFRKTPFLASGATRAGLDTRLHGVFPRTEWRPISPARFVIFRQVRTLPDFKLGRVAVETRTCNDAQI